jgi:hypothetical protein
MFYKETMMAGLPEILKYFGGDTMVKGAVLNKDGLDEEWVDLILYAIEIGMSVHEIQAFFRKSEEDIELSTENA